MKKRILALLLALLVFLPLLASAEDNVYRLLRQGSVGDDVQTMKKRLYDLGYYTTTVLNGTYNDTTTEIIVAFQKLNGLLMTGEADPYTQALLYSDAAIRADGKPVSETAVPPAEGSGGNGQYRALAEDSFGDDVLAVKKAFYGLGIYKTTDFNNVFNGIMTDRVKGYEAENGLTADGVLTPEEQLFLLGERSLSAVELPTASVTLPALNESGFLPEGVSPFVVSDFDGGAWYYIDQQLYIEILRYRDISSDITWFETDLRCAPGVTWNALLSRGSREDGHNFEDGMTIADRGRAILAFTDDNFGYRWYQNRVNRNAQYQEGVILRDGVIRSAEGPTRDYYDFPTLDVMAYYPDGRIELYYPEEHTAQEYLEMGALHVFSFGPILLRDGQVNERLYSPASKTQATEYIEQAARQAIGCYEPGHYCLVTVNGNHDTRTGVVMQWMVNKMMEKGVSDAFNLDGGRTTLLYFMGQAVNKKENVNRSAMREISSLIGIGTRE